MSGIFGVGVLSFFLKKMHFVLRVVPLPLAALPFWGGEVSYAFVVGVLEAELLDAVVLADCKVAIMRHGSTWISSIGATLNHSMMSMTDEFSSKNVLQRVHTGTKNDVLAKS